LILLALPREVQELSKFKDLPKGLGHRVPIEFQWISQTSPKPLQLMAGGFAAEGNLKAMSHDVEITPAAERMRRHRERRRGGLRCLIIELRETEIDALARNGFLKTDARNDLRAIEMALYQFLERTLG